MGLQGHLGDVSSDSIPLLLVAIVASCVGYLRSFLFGFLQSLGFSRSRFNVDEVRHHELFGTVGSGLAGLIVLTQQLNLNPVFSYSYRNAAGAGAAGTMGTDCVVCLRRLRDGDQVRRLECRHVFHKECLDGWLDHLNWNCPLCRWPLVSEERITATQRRVSEDLIRWFSVR